MTNRNSIVPSFIILPYDNVHPSPRPAATSFRSPHSHANFIPSLFQVRQITITIRTIVNGLCYLATFVFGINSVGLFLYSGQLALNSFTGDSATNETKNGQMQPLDSSSAPSKVPKDASGINGGDEDHSSDKSR